MLSAPSTSDDTRDEERKNAVAKTRKEEEERLYNIHMKWIKCTENKWITVRLAGGRAGKYCELASKTTHE